MSHMQCHLAVLHRPRVSQDFPRIRTSSRPSNHDLLVGGHPAREVIDLGQTFRGTAGLHALNQVTTHAPPACRRVSSLEIRSTGTVPPWLQLCVDVWFSVGGRPRSPMTHTRSDELDSPTISSISCCEAQSASQGFRGDRERYGGKLS